MHTLYVISVLGPQNEPIALALALHQTPKLRLMGLLLRGGEGTTMSQTPLQLCTGCTLHVLTSRWLSWRTGATWSRATILESAGSCRRPAQASPTSVSIVKPTARATIPANNCWSTDISSRCITPLELIAIRYPSQASSSLSAFRQRLKTFLFHQSFPDIVL